MDTKNGATTMELLSDELDALIKLDAKRTEVQAQMNALNSQRERQLGRMEVIAEQADIILEEYVGAELKNGRANKVLGAN